MENVKVHDGKNHSLENSEVVCLLNTNALNFKDKAVIFNSMCNLKYFSEYKKNI